MTYIKYQFCSEVNSRTISEKGQQPLFFVENMFCLKKNHRNQNYYISCEQITSIKFLISTLFLSLDSCTHFVRINRFTTFLD